MVALNWTHYRLQVGEQEIVSQLGIELTRKWGDIRSHFHGHSKLVTVGFYMLASKYVGHSLFFTKAGCQAWLKLLIANEVRIGGPGGR